MLIYLIACPLLLPLVSVGFPPATHGVAALVAQRIVLAHDSTDSQVVPVPLTEDLLTRYIAVKQDLQTFWLAHPTLLAEAQATAHHPMVDLSGIGDNQEIYDESFVCVTLAADTPAVAAIFAKHHFAPAQFEPVQISVFRGGVALRRTQATQTAPPFSTESVDAKNMMLVQSHELQLMNSGLIPKMNIFMRLSL